MVQNMLGPCDTLSTLVRNTILYNGWFLTVVILNICSPYF